MGYRNCFYIADKKKLNKIRKMTRKELWELVEETPYSDSAYPFFIDVLEKIGAEKAMDMGKEVDYTKRLEPFFKPLFRDKNTNKHYNMETECFLSKPEILQEIATIFKEKVQNYYKSLLEEKSPNEFDERTQFERLLASAKQNLMWACYLDKLSENKYSLGGGWLYEHEVFNVLYLMRILNPKKQCLIYVGC